MAESRKRQSPGASSSSGAPAKKPATRKPRTRARTHEGIAERAYAISQSDACGSPEENWLRAEQELMHGS